MSCTHANASSAPRRRQHGCWPAVLWSLVLAAGPVPAQNSDEAAAPVGVSQAGVDEDASGQTPADAAAQAAGPETAEPSDDAESAPSSTAFDSAQPVTRFEAELAFDRLFAVDDFDAAVGIGEQMVDLTAEEFGADSVETGKAYTELGAAQREAGDFADAEESYLRAVEIMRKTGGPYSENLIDPLVGLGDTYQADAQYLNAVSAYNEARSVNRRVYGLLNEAQIPILDRMTESFYEMEEFDKADEQQQAALRLIERVYEPGSPEVLEAIYKYADWLARNRRFTDARTQYQRAIHTIREQYGEEDGRLVEPLRRVGNSYRLQRAAVGEGIASLTQALEILSSEDDPDPLELATVLRDVGDWRTAFSSVPPDNAEYRRAWETLGDVDDGERLREEWFSGIHYVLSEPHSSRGLSTDADAVPGSVVVRFDIDTAGRSENVAVIESDPPGFNEEAFMRQVRRSRFRPHMRDGVVVPARRLGLRFTFTYLPDDHEDD